MKIAFAYDVPYPWHIGGIEFLNFSEAQALARRNDVHFFTLRWPEMKENFRYEGIRYHTFHNVTQKQVYRHGRRSIREAVFFSFGLFKMFSYDFDVVITDQFPVLHLPTVKLYCWLKHSKLVLEVAEVWDRAYWNEYLGSGLGWIAHGLTSLFIRNADMYVVDSSTTGNRLASIFRIDKKKIVQYAPSVDDKLIGKVNNGYSGLRDKTVIFSGRLIKEKRLDKWIEVVEKAIRKSPGIRGVIVGAGPEYDSIKSLIEKKGLSGKIELRPFYKEKRDFYRELRRSGMILHMSEREGLGIIVIESVALGTPVLLPDYTPLPKEIKGMCVVEHEKDMPGKIVEMLNSRSKEKYISNTKNIDRFLISNVIPVFSRIFKDIGLKD
ncbi:MAG: glycosyltransferase family 4 protein [Candidatus Micrarchaeota archaeon]|nr:glycosyltransferase family 4 protein [Candidatus Micrarchaeota archaeon]